jgi:SAM-dependent methyltransferase
MSLRNHVERRYHEYFRRAFTGTDSRGQTLLEVGAGRSRWLPYFAREFGFEVTGIDYSAAACEQGAAILRQAGVNGSVIEADLFDPPASLLESFDVVVSFGLIEHFEDTSACVASLARFLKPGGLIISSIPNLSGTIGWMQKRICRDVYDVHVPLDRNTLRGAHERAGLLVLSCDYFLGADLSALNLSCWSDARFYGAALRLAFSGSLGLWWLDEKRVRARPNRWTSRALICSARKPLP